MSATAFNPDNAALLAQLRVRAASVADPAQRTRVERLAALVADAPGPAPAALTALPVRPPTEAERQRGVELEAEASAALAGHGRPAALA